MLGKKKFKAPKITTVIGTGTVIQGDVVFSGGLHVDGTIHGNVLAEEDERAALILSEQGVIEGDVKVPNIILNGTVAGDVFASERVELIANARVSGTLYYKLLEMAMGAEINGQLVFTEQAESPRLGYDNKGMAGAAEAVNDGVLEIEEAAQKPTTTTE